MKCRCCVPRSRQLSTRDAQVIFAARDHRELGPQVVALESHLDAPLGDGVLAGGLWSVELKATMNLFGVPALGSTDWRSTVETPAHPAFASSGLLPTKDLLVGVVRLLYTRNALALHGDIRTRSPDEFLTCSECGRDLWLVHPRLQWRPHPSRLTSKRSCVIAAPTRHSPLRDSARSGDDDDRDR